MADEAVAPISLPGLEFRHKTTTLTPGKATIIVEAIRRGVSRYGAAALAGVPPSTFCGWLESAVETNDPPTTALLAAILQAEADFEERNIVAAEKKARDTDDHVKLLTHHPSTRSRYGIKDDSKFVAVQINIGFEPPE